MCEQAAESRQDTPPTTIQVEKFPNPAGEVKTADGVMSLLPSWKITTKLVQIQTHEHRDALQLDLDL